MENFWFVIKSLIVTVCFVMLLQIKISEEVTLERKAVGWLQSNAAVDVLRGVAEGAVKVTRQVYHGSMGVMDRTLGQAFGARAEQPGKRQGFFAPERSEAVRQAEELKREAAAATSSVDEAIPKSATESP